MNNLGIAVIVIGILLALAIYYFKFLWRKARYPEIQKFCEWFKKQQAEEGLNLVGMSLCPSSTNNTLQTGSEPFRIDDLERLIGRRVEFTPPMIDELMAYVSNCKRTAGFDYFEKVCADFLHIENLIQNGETKPTPGLF